MPAPVIIKHKTYARSGLVGNPSDMFGGKVISLLFDAFCAELTLYESPLLHIRPGTRDRVTWNTMDELVSYRTRFGYYGGMRLIEAILIRFQKHCMEAGIGLPDRRFTVGYASTVPFAVGLGGSSAIAGATLKAVMAFFELDEQDIPKPLQARVMLEAETMELGISAGLQDRVVMVYGGLVAMDFTPEALSRDDGVSGTYSSLDPSLLPPLYVVYDQSLSKSSGEIHNVMRYRATVEHDQHVVAAMRQKAALADEALAALTSGRPDQLGDIMSRDFEIRRSVYQLSPSQSRLVEIARANGSHANFSGSGGAAIGTYEDERHRERLRRAFAAEGLSVVQVHVPPVEGG